MRAVSATAPSFIGTLRSARTSTRLPRTSRSSRVLNLFIIYTLTLAGGESVTQINLPIATAVSAMRLEKPHSLSYQLITLTKAPSITLVWSSAKDDDAGLWLKSLDTSGASTTSRMPLSAPAAAALIAPLISSTLVGRLATNLRSTSDTFGVGTRTETPSSLPLSSGRTNPTALAAPVDVGIIDS